MVDVRALRAVTVRVAAVDCGTNSVRLLIADVRDGVVHDVVRELDVVRLGQDVDRTGRLASDALARTRTALARFAASIRTANVSAVRMAATSATRDATNRDEFAAMVRGELGIEPEVITGAEEAALSFAGAASVIDVGRDRALLVADIGGGSTELVMGGRGGALRAHSMQIGCVRLTERHLRDDPPSAAQLAAATADVRAGLDEAQRDVPLDEQATFVGVAGTVTTIAAIALNLGRDDAAAVHGARLTRRQVHDVTRMLLTMPRAERAALPVMHPGRVDVIAAGALVLREIVDTVGTDEIVVSTHDILDGIALQLAASATS